MKFYRAERKIREMENHFSRLSISQNVDDFEDNFAAFIGASRSVTLALQTDADIAFNEDGSIKRKGPINGFIDWYIKKQTEMKQDELCKFFKDTRDLDVHTGSSVLNSVYEIKGGVTLSAPKGGLLVIGARGTYEVYDHDSSKEKRVQKKIQNEVFQISMNNLPTKHLGKQIENNNPIKSCMLYKDYLTALVVEAKEIFMNIN